MWGPKSHQDSASCRCHSLPNPTSSGPPDGSGLQSSSHSQESIQITCGCSSNSLDSLTTQLNSLAEPLCQLTSALESINIPACDSQVSLPGPPQGQPSTLSLQQENLSASESCEAIEFCCLQTSTVQTETRQPEPPRQPPPTANPLEALCKCLEKATTKHHGPGC